MVVNSRLPKTDKRPVLCERHFWVFAFGIIIVSIVTRVFDFSLMPPSYQGLFITRPYYGLHSWANANRAWAARSHVKYGLGYTRGYRTLVVGDPPPTHPQRYVSHPSLETLITAFGMLLFGTGEWAIPAVVPWRVRLDTIHTGSTTDIAFAAEVIWVWLCALVGFAAGYLAPLGVFWL